MGRCRFSAFGALSLKPNRVAEADPEPSASPSRNDRKLRRALGFHPPTQPPAGLAAYLKAVDLRLDSELAPPGAGRSTPRPGLPDMRRHPAIVALVLVAALERADAQAPPPEDARGGGPLAAITGSEQLERQARRFVWDTRYDEAEAIYRRLLERDPADAGAGAGLALALARQNRLRDGESTARGVIERDPQAFEARLVLAEILLRTEHPGEALAEYDRAASIDPKDPRSAAGRARALAAAGQEDEARAVDEASAVWFASRAARDPKDLEVRLAHAAALLRLGRPEEALAEYDAVLGVDPKDREAGVGRARVLLRLERPREALEEAERAIAAHPVAAEAHGVLGTAELHLGRPAEGAATFARAAELDRWNPDYRIGTARCRWANADVAGARASCAEALGLDARNAEAEELLARIDSTPPPRGFRLFTALRWDFLSGDRDDWLQETVHLAWRARPDLVLGIGLDAYDRYDEHDVQVSGDCAWRFHEDWTWSTTLVYGPDAEVVARGAIDLELARGLGRGTTGFLRWRHSEFAGDVDVDLLSPGVELPVASKCSLTARYYLVDDSDTGRGDGGMLRLAIAPEDRWSGTAGVAYGTETFLTNTPEPATRGSDVLTLFAGLRWRASDRAQLRLDYDFEDHESAYTKHGIALGLAFDL